MVKTIVPLLIALLALSTPAELEATTEQGTTVQAVETAISWLVRKNKRHPLSKREDRRAAMAAAIVEAATRHALPPLLVTAIVFRESSFRREARGDLREIGLMQVVPAVARKRGCDMLTIEGQLDCGASFLRHCVDKCGGLKAGFALYASGRRCKADSDHLFQVVFDRFNLWRKLRELGQWESKTK